MLNEVFGEFLKFYEIVSLGAPGVPPMTDLTG